jgi:uncharacterized protein YggU (UPF0235/DUF167 family)
VPPPSPHPRGCEIALTISPRSAVNRLEWGPEGTLRAHIAAPPVDGAANAALLRYVSKLLDIPKSQLTITAGHTSRHKRLLITGLSPADLDQRLHKALATTAR